MVTTPRRKHETGPGGGVGEILLRQLGKELGGADQEGAGRQHHQEAGAILAGRQDSEVDHRPAAADLPRDHEHEGERANGRGRDDEGRAEPVVYKPAVEHEFERAEEGRNQHEADEIESAPLLLQPLALRGCGFRLAQDQRDQRDRDEADRAVDQKAPLPGIVVGQPPAERRPHDGGNHDGNTEQREGLAALRRREGIRQDRL